MLPRSLAVLSLVFLVLFSACSKAEGDEYGVSIVNSDGSYIYLEPVLDEPTVLEDPVVVESTPSVYFSPVSAYSFASPDYVIQYGRPLKNTARATSRVFKRLEVAVSQPFKRSRARRANRLSGRYWRLCR